MQAILRIDGLLFRLERGLAATLISLMGIVVFFDVAHRMSTRAGSLTASPYFVGSAAAILVALGLRTRGDGSVLWKSAVAGIAVGGGQPIFLHLFPNGLIWSQTFALSLTLWLGMLGASLAAHERRHLALDIGGRIWPEALRPKVAAVGHFVTAGFCGLLVILGTRSVISHWELWTATEHAAGILSGLPIPKWAPAFAIPFGATMLSLRFLLEGVRTWTGDLKPAGDDTLHQLGIDTEGQP